MMKGRRVRADVIGCPPRTNDELCSPNPKRKGPKPAPSRPKVAITAFFKAVSENKEILEDIKKPFIETNELIYECGGIDEVTELKMMDVVTKSPAIKLELERMAAPSPPTTPHRIQLFLEDAEAKGIQEGSPKARLKVPPKARRKLVNDDPKNNQISNNHKLTDYFPVRRSIRKTKTTVLEEKQRSLEQLLRKNVEEGLEVRIFENKGRGVVASKFFSKGDFVVEYSGDLIDISEAKRREEKYAQDQNTGCYMYYFKHNEQQYCVDATAESGKLGRLVNHSRNGNLITRTVSVDSRPRLVLIAKDDIKEGDEITYDYGDRSKESLRHHPWLAY